MKARSALTASFFSVSILALTPSIAYAQTTADNAQADEIADDEEIVVTGTNASRNAQNTPLSIALVDEADLRTFTGSGSQADLLQQLPGLKTEGGGGEVATNFRVRGLPSGGQFEFTPINYDGVTALSAFGLNSSAFDFFARNDLGIERLEFVKGGVSNLFGVSSTAGIINYISKTGTPESHGTFQLEVAEDNRYRGDFAYQGPLGENTFMAVSGFYRYDEGPLDTGIPTEGFALRGNIKHEFADGSGSFTLYGSYIDDRANFYLPLPLDGTTRRRVNGNDGNTVFTTNASAIDGLRVNTPEGATEFRAGDGFQTEGGSIYAVFDKEFGDGWKINSKVKWSKYQSASNFFSNGIGPAAPETQAQFLTRVAPTATLAQAVFTDVETGAVLPANYLLYANAFNDRQRPTSDATMELNLIKSFDTGSVSHTVTLGGFMSRAEADNNQRTVQYLGQFNNNPSLVNLAINGQQYTVNGIIQAPSAYTQETRSAFKRAIYLADQIEADRWTLDFGVRVERATIENRIEVTGSRAGTLATNAVAGAPINTMTFGTGTFREGKASTTAWAFAIGGLYKLTDNVNLYANASAGYFFPQAQGTNAQLNSANRDIVFFEPEPVNQVEAGIKVRSGAFRGYAAAFYTGLRKRTSVSFVGANLTPSLLLTESDTFGIELDGNFQPTDYLTLSGNFTYQDAKFVGNSPATINGKRPDRLPKMLANIGAQLNASGFDASVFWNHQSKTFQDASNNVPLFAYSIWRAEAGYTFDGLGAENKLRFSVGVWNLLNSQGLAEGNPRAGAIQTGGTGAYFNGRPILPRRITAKLTFDF
jgi:iron complex outermembrane recepter protein